MAAVGIGNANDVHGANECAGWAVSILDRPTKHVHIFRRVDDPMVWNLRVAVEPGVEHHSRGINQRPNALVTRGIVNVTAQDPSGRKFEIPEILISVVMAPVG
jgi:hypothetical protein